MRQIFGLRERTLLQHWLPALSPLGEEQTDARALVASETSLAPTEVADRLEKLRVQLAAFRADRLTIEVMPPLGRGRRRREGGLDIDSLSDWELAWLHVDRLRPSNAGQLSLLAQTLATSDLNALALAVCCLPLEDAETLTSELRSSEPWAAWLAGDKLDLARADLSCVGDASERQLQLALEGAWPALRAKLPKADRVPKLEPLGHRATDFQFLSQLAACMIDGRPDRATAESSLRALLGCGELKPHEWHRADLERRLGIVAAFTTAFGEAPLTTLRLSREQNDHWRDPPPRSFVTPQEVIIAAEKLEAALVWALNEGRTFTIGPSDDGLELES